MCVWGYGGGGGGGGGEEGGDRGTGTAGRIFFFFFFVIHMSTIWIDVMNPVCLAGQRLSALHGKHFSVRQTHKLFDQIFSYLPC